MATKFPECKTNGICFARNMNNTCSILIECSRKCSFQKPAKEWTNGKIYPFNPQAAIENEQLQKAKKRNMITLEQWRALQRI